MTNKNVNIDISDELRNEINNIFIKFQEGYSNRDISKLDSFMEELFVKSDELAILGTGIGEWSLGYEQSKELIESDWEGWGDLNINSNDIEIDTVGEHVWVTLKGTVKYEFSDEGNKYDRYVDFITGFYHPENVNSEMPDKYKTAHMNWILTQAFQNREEATRTYLWPLRISAVLRRENRMLKFIEMQFCLPAASRYPDVKLDFDKSMQMNIHGGSAIINEYLERTGFRSKGELKNLITDFIKDYNNNETGVEEFAQKYFEVKNSIVIDTDLELHKGIDQIKSWLEESRRNWDSIGINHNDIIQRVYGDTALVSAWGVLCRNITEQRALADLGEEILRIVELDIPSKEKIFRVQKQITLVHRELSAQQESKWCFKLEGLLQREEGKWKFNKLQLSFPFYYVVEGMYDVEPVG